MTDKVRERLKELAAFLENEHAVDNVEESVDHLQRAIAECMVRSRALAQQATIFVFQSHDPPSLLQFLDASNTMGEDMRKREISHARIKVLELLAEFVKSYGGHVAVTRKHIAQITRNCQTIARGDWSNKVRAVALKLVINVLKYASSRLAAEDLEPATYMDKLFYDLKFSKATQTAKACGSMRIYQAASKVPELLPWIEDLLEKQFASNAPEMLLIHGILEALARLLVFDAERYKGKENDAKRQKIYSYLHKILATTVDGQLSRYQVTKAGLRFLAYHARIFEQEIGPNAYLWFTFMRFCTQSDTKTIKENAYAASDSVMQTVGNYLGKEEKDEQRKKSVNRLLKDLLPVLADANATSPMVAFTLQCISCLSPAIMLYLGETGFVKIEDRLRKFGDSLLVLGERATAMRWSVFSSFIQCLGTFAEQPRKGELDDAYIGCLEAIICHVLNAFPYSVWKSKVMLYKSILLIIGAAQKKNADQLMMNRIVRHLLLLTVSNVTDMQDMLILYHPETGNAETKLLYEFEDLWVAMLRGKKYVKYKSKYALESITKDTEKNESYHELAGIRQRLLNTMLHALFEIIGDLDLTYQYDLQEARSGSSGGGYKPNVPRDHSIMLNVTELVERLLPRLQVEHLRLWIPTAMISMFEKSRQLPLVSAFYRITRVFALAVDALRLFDPANGNERTKEITALQSQYAAFTTRVVHNLRFYKDELLVATSGCVLATPIRLLTVDDYAKALVPALLIGRSYLPAADMAITSLEKWQKEDGTKLESIYDRVIPCLAVYLDQGDPASNDADASSLPLSKEKNVSITEAAGDSDWSKLQRRIMVFLGKAGGKASLILSQDADASSTIPAGRGFSSNPLSLSIKLGDVLVDLSLDSLLLHIGGLACESTDRRVKAAACELYHALISYLCGETATHPHTSGSKSTYHSAWKSLFPVVVRLATDTERICRSLFEPLLFQITRWFCHGSDTFPHEFSIVMDELIEGLSHETSTAIREISGKCLSTCLSSAIESNATDPAASLAKAETVFQRLFSLCRHPGPAQRTGAATALSYFLRTLREDDITVVQAFGLRCLKNFLFSLKLCGHDTRVGKTNVQILQDMITKAILRLQRAVVRYPTAFTQIKKEITSDSESPEEGIDLGSFTEWIFSQCANRETVYRATCRQLFLAFTPIISGSNCKRWIQDYAKKQQHGVHHVLAPLDQLAVLIHAEDRTNWNLEILVDWLDQLTASVECYTWCSEILGVDAVTILCAEDSGGLKRKLVEQNDPSALAGDSSDQLGIAWAVHRLAKQHKELIAFQQDTTKNLNVDIQVSVRRSLIQAMATICDFWGATFKSPANAVATRILHVENGSRQHEMASQIIEVFMLCHDVNVRNDSQTHDNLKKIKLFCGGGAAAAAAATRSIMGLAHELAKVGNEYTDKVFDRINGTLWEQDKDAVLQRFRVVNELMECGAISCSTNASRSDALLKVATTLLEGACVSPRDRSLALESVKIACCYGWSIGAVYDDKSLERRLATINRELFRFFASPLIWNQVATALVIWTYDAETTTQRLGAVVELLSQVASSKAFPARSSAMDAFVETYLPHFENLIKQVLDESSSLDLQRSRLVLDVILQSVPILGMCSKSIADNLSSGVFVEIRKCVLSLLARRELSHFAKSDCLSVLAALGPGQNPEQSKTVLNALAMFVVDQFPIKSTDVKAGSRDYDIFRLLFGKLLLVVEEAGRADYLEAIYFALKEGESHLFADDLNASLGRLATSVASRETNLVDDVKSPEGQLEFMVQLTDILLDPTVDTAVRRILLDQLCIPLIELLSGANLEKFYLSQASKSSNANVISKIATVVANSGEIVTTGAFLTSAVAYTLVEVLYRLVDPDQIRGDINAAFLGHANGKGREFTMLVCKCASKFVTKTYDDMNDLTRFACWKAYNCLLTAVSRTQKQEKFYDQILFQESLWTNIVDVAREYELPTETKPFDRVPLSSFSATTLRQQQEHQQQGRATQSGARDPRGSSRDASASLRFFTGSSLSQTAMTSSASLQQIASSELAAREANYFGTEIELDAINDHPCMIPLLRVLKQMKADFGSGWDAGLMPGWMKKIFGVIADQTTELNIRLFIVKVVLDVPDVFQPYSHLWADKLMDALLEATVSSSSGKPAEFHYLLRDCCALLTDEWKDADLSSARTTASRFLNELIELAPNDANMIMQDNLVLISKLILQWKSYVRIDMAIVSKLLLSQDDNPRLEAANRYTALQVISVMLSAGLADEITSDFEHSMDDTNNLENGILQAIEHKRPSIYNVAAEVSGLLLSAQADAMGTATTTGAQSFRNQLVDRITKYYNEEDFGRFLALLRSVSLHDPSVLDSTMLHRLSFVLPKVVAIEAWSLSAVECLNNAVKNVGVVKELFTHCQPVLARFLSHRNGAVQLHAVRLVEALVDHLDDAALNRLVQTDQNTGIDLFGHAIDQQDVTVRQVLISLAMSLHKKQLDSAVSEKIHQQLLRGLADQDPEIRKQVLDFWSKSETLATSCSGRLVDLFQSFFAAPVADQWVLYATNLLLGMNVGTTNYDTTLFKSALSQGEFHDAAIDSAWESKDQTMTPLFSVEADKFSAAALMSRASQNTGSLSSQAFSVGSASQLDGSLASQSQLIASSLASQAVFSLGSLGSSQGDGMGSQQQRRRRFSTRSGTAGSTSLSQTGSAASKPGKYARNADKNYFQEQHAILKKNEEALLNRQRMARAQQVVMRRKYRVGDYPDIQIKLRDIVDPLMALCEMHPTTSSVVFAGLMPAILSSKDLMEKEDCLHELGLQMESDLSQGKHSLVFVGAVHLAYFSSFMKDAGLVRSIGISFKTIGESSLASSSNLSGQLILEEYLNHKVPQSTDASAECWDQLYKILAANQKSNLLVALASQCCTVEDSKIALQAQLAGDLPGAIACYRKAETTLDLELDMQAEGTLLAARFELHRSTWERFACLERLNNWSKLEREFIVAENDKEFDFVWHEQSPYREQGIGHCLRSQLGLLVLQEKDTIEHSENFYKLKDFLKQAHAEPSRWETVMSRFGVEICLSAIAMDDAGQARVLVEQLYPLILKRWSATSKIARLTRLELLQNLSSAVEIDEALRLLGGFDVAKSKQSEKEKLAMFSRNWSSVVPSLGGGSMASWSQFYMTQQVLVGFIERTGKTEGLVSKETLHAMHQDTAQLMLRYAGAAVQNDILALASKYLKDYRELCNKQQLPKVSVLMVDVFVSHVLKLAERQAQKTSLSGEGLASDAVNAITRYYQTSTKMFDNSDILELMEQLPLADRVAIGSLEAKTFGTAAQFHMKAGLDSATTEEFFTRAFDVFQRSSRVIPGSENGADGTGSIRLPAPSFTRCRTKFIEFLMDILFSESISEWTAFIDRKTLVQALMENVLGGMASGDQECANYFPQLCELVPAFPAIVTEFEKRVLTQVPIWTCLRWSSQLLALVQGPIRPTIIRILEKMAAEYPAALFYDFTLTSGDLAANGATVDLSRLQLLVSNPVMEKFVDALRLIHHPELRLKEGLREVAKLLDEGKQAAAKTKVAHIWQDCFTTEQHVRLGGKIGRYNRDWARRAKKDVEKIMGRDGATLTAKSVLAAREWINNTFNVVPGKHGITKDMKARLADFAEWLDEFDHSKCRLELPGQYATGWGKPDPSSHVHILSIHSTLGVLASKQLPKQITFHCSDQNNYTFLVKGGEDLRLDQRIEQLLDVMNQILASDARCRDRNLHTKTYKVIPMTAEIGMIEWLHGTSTLKGIIEQQLQQDPRCDQLASNKRAKLQLFNTIPAKQYETFLMKQRGSTFAAKVVAPSRQDVTTSFHDVQNQIPEDLLRRQLLTLGCDFEDFISIRDEFASSLAVFSACSYILGIGDRHLDNFLLDHRTGRVIGIDFGVSFGAGASVLPVPELIPFRFTRQMESVLHPYDSANLLIQDMQAVFEALREKKQVIESVMNVFLHEPLLDWQQSTTTHQQVIFKDMSNSSSTSTSTSQEATQEDSDIDSIKEEEADFASDGHGKPAKRARKGHSSTASPSPLPSPSTSSSSSSRSRSSSSSSSSSSAPSAAATLVAWLPDVKIAIARRKLEGFSPRVLLKEELSQNPHLGKQLKHFHALVDTAMVAAAPQSDVAMSSLAQAQELIALATAPDLLGRTYHGWMPWL